MKRRTNHLVVITFLLFVLMGCSRSGFDLGEPDVQPDDPVASHVASNWLKLSTTAYIRAALSVGKHVWVGTNTGIARYDTESGQTRHFTPANSGLPGSDVAALTHDGNRGIYIATKGGLAHFSGETWTEIPSPTANDRTMTVTHLAVDGSGRLFAAVDLSGLVVLDETWTVVGSVPEGRIMGLVSAADGSVWCAKRRERTSWFEPPGVEPTFVGGGVLHVPAGSSNAIWFQGELPSADLRDIDLGGDGSVYMLDTADEQRVTILSEGAISTFEAPIAIWDLTLDRADGLWAASSQGVWRLHQGAGIKIDGPGGPDQDVERLWLVDSTSRIWASKLGLFQGTQEGWSPRSVANSDLLSNRIRDLARDAEGVIWLATYGAGLVRYDGEWSSFGESSWVGTDFVDAVSVDRDGRLWLMTSDSRLLRMDGPSIMEVETPFSFTTHSLETDCAGDVWVGGMLGANGGAARLRGERWEFFNHDVLPNHSVKSIACAADGDVWVGTLVGNVARFDGARWSHVESTEPGAPGDFIQNVRVDREDNVWVGHQSVGEVGISRFDGASWSSVDLADTESVVAATLDLASLDGRANDVVFIADGRLMRVDPLTLGVSAVSSRRVLLDGYGRSTLRDSLGNTWFAGDGGLTIYNPMGVAGFDRTFAHQAALLDR